MKTTNRQKKRCALALALGAVMCAGVCGGLVGCTDIDDGSSWVDYGEYDKASSFSTGSFSYNAAEVDSIRLDWVVGSVKFVASDAEVLNVTEAGADLVDSEKVHWLIDGGVLRIRFWASGYYAEADASKKAITVEIPKSLSAFSTHTVSAPIIADEISAGAVELSTVSGNVDVNSVAASGTFSAESVSASVEVDSLDAAVVEVSVTSGEVSMGVSAVDTQVDSVSGDVVLDIKTVGQTDVETVSGDVSISLSNGNGATVEYDTVSGDMNSQSEYTVVNGHSVFGNGLCAVNVDTVSGDLNVAVK